MSEIKGKQNDTLYLSQEVHPGDFVFDEQVVSVFPDMIRRSVPGYASVVAMVAELAKTYAQPGTNIYDLGCSLGAVTLAVADAVPQRNVSIVAVDLSEAMIQGLRAELNGQPAAARISVLHEDVCDVSISNASLVVMNYTLQFLSVEKRDALVQKVFSGLVPGGVFVLSEKVRFDNPKVQRVQEELHTAYKKNHGYSDLEVSRKRTALENVLITETVDTHRKRLAQAGFGVAEVWFQCFNFVSMLAIR